MRRAAVLSVLAALVVVPLAAAAAGTGVVHAPRPPGATRKQWGADLYAANCLRCHGTDGEGTPSNGPSLRGVGARAADFYLRTGYMPLAAPGDQPHRADVQFSPREIAALEAYVASLGQGPPVPKPHPRRGSLAEGLQLFTDHCAGCHQVAGQGGYVKGAVVPSLDQATPTQIAEAVRIGPFLMPHFSTQQISDWQLDSIVAYVRYTQHPDDAGGWPLGHLGPVPEGLVTWLIAAAALVAVCFAIGERRRRRQ
jgi:ubiquinol-cytochrome c reductase cytochrome c subunit